MSALQTEQAKVAKLETCDCDLKDGATQTAETKTTAVATSTDTISQVFIYFVINFLKGFMELI